MYILTSSVNLQRAISQALLKTATIAFCWYEFYSIKVHCKTAAIFAQTTIPLRRRMCNTTMLHMISARRARLDEARILEVLLYHSSPGQQTRPFSVPAEGANSIRRTLRLRSDDVFHFFFFFSKWVIEKHISIFFGMKSKQRLARSYCREHFRA